MPRFHHANIAVRPDQEAEEHAFLIEVLGYRKLEAPEEFRDQARWYGSDDGVEIHLSLDPEHEPARRAHTAIEIDGGVEQRLTAAGVTYKRGQFGDLCLVLCEDPAGNHWELRLTKMSEVNE